LRGIEHRDDRGAAGVRIELFQHALSKSFEGKVVIVTGANSGIGEAAAAALEAIFQKDAIEGTRYGADQMKHLDSER
jgi:hypothetical protein